jgi:hypothetical protein
MVRVKVEAHASAPDSTLVLESVLKWDSLLAPELLGPVKVLA